ncbi:FecR family protein [Agaribacter flavus]|uniref:FecR family protein n=1 Tax=Agaribacter flavus TaxID=1902781 RepID=A0ABV7FWW8_9ALTE
MDNDKKNTPSAKTDSLEQDIWHDPALHQALTQIRDAQAPRQHKRMAFWYTGMAACLLLAVVLFNKTPSTSELTVAKAKVEPLYYSTASAEQRAFELSDGSSIRLNASTKITVALSDTQRLVSFDEGEAYFDVQHKPETPFQIRSFYGEIHVVGTEFNVEQSKQGLRVSVYEGVVEVINRHGELIVLTQGQRVSLDTLGQFEEKTRFDEAAPVDWQHGLLNAQSIPLQLVVERLNRYSHKPLYLAPELNTKKVTGSFMLRDVPASVRLISELYNLKINENKDNIYLSAL